MKKKYSLYNITIFLVFLVSAIPITTFDNYSSPENLTYSGNQNNTRNLTLFRYANITSAYMNLSGFDSPDIIETNETNNIGQNSRAGVFESCTNITLPDVSRMNITFSASGISPYASIRIRDSSKTILEEINDTDNNDNVVSINYYEPIEYGICIRDFNASDGFKYNVQNDFDGYRVTGTSTSSDKPYINLKTITSYITNISNPFISINGTHIWNYTGNFTLKNNKTSDFSDTFNTALNSGACNCDGCTLIGNNCSINFTFHSDDAGKIQYSDIKIDWLEYTTPNLTINNPISDPGSKTFLVNITVQDDWASDYCYFNITRGASLEVANTEIPNCTTKSTTVSGFADYVIHVFSNDTSNNINTTNQSFTVSSTTGGSGAGGGVATPKLPEEEEEFENICIKYKPDLIESWNIFKKDMNLDNFILLWYTFWNYELCQSAASVVYLGE